MAQEYGKRNNIMILDEWSAMLDINIQESFDFLINLVHKTQMELVKQNKRSMRTIKLSIEQEIEIERKREKDKWWK